MNKFYTVQLVCKSELVVISAKTYKEALKMSKDISIYDLNCCTIKRAIKEIKTNKEGGRT